jgi:hypothetical protein
MNLLEVLEIFNSHNEATKGLLKSVDKLHNEKLVNSINIFSYVAEKEVCRIKLEQDGWTKKQLPSFYIEQERNSQKTNNEFLSKHIDLGKQTLKTINPALKDDVQKIIEKLSCLIQPEQSCCWHR